MAEDLLDPLRRPRVDLLGVLEGRRRELEEAAGDVLVLLGGLDDPEDLLEDAPVRGEGLVAPRLAPLDPQGDPWTLFPTPGEFPFEGIDPQWGAYFRIALPGSESPRYSNSPATIDTFPASLGFIIHKGDTKEPGPDQLPPSSL